MINTLTFKDYFKHIVFTAAVSGNDGAVNTITNLNVFCIFSK